MVNIVIISNNVHCNLLLLLLSPLEYTFYAVHKRHIYLLYLDFKNFFSSVARVILDLFPFNELMNPNLVLFKKKIIN